MADYIPKADAEFNVWQSNLVEEVDDNATAWGIAAADVTTLVAIQTQWNTDYTKADNRQNRSSADVQAKDDSRRAYEKEIRQFVNQWLANNTRVSNADRERMGLTIKDGTRTPVPVPSAKPAVTVDFAVRFQHTLHISNESGTRSKAKPEGVHGCEIWRKIGDAPKDATELIYVGTSTRNSYIVTYDGDAVGKTVWYWVRWINTRGQAGPWGNAASAMVAG